MLELAKCLFFLFSHLEGATAIQALQIPSFAPKLEEKWLQSVIAPISLRSHFVG
jgi:hypothetical protein